MLHDILMGTAAVFSGVTTVVVVTLAFKWGRWTGVVDTKFDTVDTRLSNIEQRLPDRRMTAR